MAFKIVTWNINGIRALPKPIDEVLMDLDADIVCFQETKVTRDQLKENLAIVDGYNSYFDYSNVRDGYSGVATYVKDSATPFKAEVGLSGRLYGNEAIGLKMDTAEFTDDEIKALDNEGRSVITQHKISDGDNGTYLTVINVYCPRADPDRDDRKIFKLQFYKLLQLRAEKILHNGSHVIVLGDVNTAHQRIDHCDPADEAEFQEHEGRKWLNSFLYHSENVKLPVNSCNSATMNLTSGHFIDAFRYLNPGKQEAYTCWNTSTGARQLNYGTRIDYIFSDFLLSKNSLLKCDILQDYTGSDHCPVYASFSCSLIPSTKCPSICTRNMPEFYGKQQKLSQFFFKCKKNEDIKLSNANDSSQNIVNCAHIEVSTSNKRTFYDKTAKESDNFVKPNKKQKKLNSFFTSSSNSNPLVSDDIGRVEISSMVSTVPDCTENINNHAKSQWKQLLKGPNSAPLCKVHKSPCALRTVKKDSLNKDRQFYCCSHPDGPKSNPLSRCDHFEWVVKNKRSK